MVETYFHPAFPVELDAESPDFSDFGIYLEPAICFGMSQDRWQSNTVERVSLGEHLINTMKVVEKLGGGAELQFYALTHDAAEIVYSDVFTNGKNEHYRRREDEFLDTLWPCYGLEGPDEDQEDLIKHADNLVQIWETREYFSDPLRASQLNDQVISGAEMAFNEEEAYEFVDEVAKKIESNEPNDIRAHYGTHLFSARDRVLY